MSLKQVLVLCSASTRFLLGYITYNNQWEPAEWQAHCEGFSYHNNNETIYFNSANKLLKMILICLKM